MPGQTTASSVKSDDLILLLFVSGSGRSGLDSLPGRRK